MRRNAQDDPLFFSIPAQIKRLMPWPIIATGLLAAVIYLAYQSNKASREQFDEWQRQRQEESGADKFLNQVKNHLAETRPFER